MNIDDGTGNSERDWEIFDILCQNIDQVETPCNIDHLTGDHLSHSIDLVTTLRSELAALTYKRDRLMNELSETKSSLCVKENECETLRAQSARQSALIMSLQQRLQATETREKNLQARSEQTSHTLQREKRGLEEKVKEMCSKQRRLEIDLSAEESLREQAKQHLAELVRKLACCMGMDINDNLTPDCVLSKTNDIVNELQRLRTKLAATCESLTTCEAELHSMRNASNTERCNLMAQIESLKMITTGLEARFKTTERDLQLTRDRLTETDMGADKLREELRGFESRCCRLQSSLDRVQNDRIVFLKNIGSIINVSEPCESLIKDKIREIMNENQTMHNQIHNMREQLNIETTRLRETQETSQSRIRAEECQRATVEEKLEKTCSELQMMRDEHLAMSEYLVRLARALCWSDCIDLPAHGGETHLLAEQLLERAEHLTIHKEHPDLCDKNCYDLPTPHHHHHHLPKLRRERSCHDLPIKEVSTCESSTIYSLQRKVRVLREQVQRRDLHLELLRRKIALLEDNARGKAILQTERDEALCRARRNNRQTEKTTHHLMEVKSQLADVKAQLADATDYKITALERARKIDELQGKILCLESEKSRLITQLSAYKTRARSAVDSSNDRRLRDDAIITNLREELGRVKAQLADANVKLTQLQTFRTTVARMLHTREHPECELLQKLQTVCNAHHEFTLLSKRYDTSPPPENNNCTQFDEPLPLPTSSSAAQCRSTSPAHRRYIDSGFDHFEDDFEYSKKF
ncbi:hypothetical protein PVAND_006316 [Polypedilum vanderplanki]|uniref:Coiled-coil domain-containing protein 170 n=1 Tax=Polypedilum vanderplanki TaxID=319348 RepID=A0A9J6C3L1_POLVA|nr:hypothetical protein PVAND_006316 [Polypedilum vanderplanki]